MDNIIKKESKLEYIFYNDQLHIYKVKKLYGFNEILDDIKEKYSDKIIAKFNHAYFDHDVQKLKILDPELLGFDDVLITSCTPKLKSKYYPNYTDYQLYTGEAQFITYPMIYKLLKENVSIENMMQWYTSSNYKPIMQSEKNNILKLLLDYIQVDHLISINIDMLDKIKMENSDDSFTYLDLNKYLNESLISNLVLDKLELSSDKSNKKYLKIVAKTNN